MKTQEVDEFETWCKQADGWLADCIGSPEDVVVEDLEMAEAVYRIVRRDSEFFVGTADLRPERVNLEIEKGCVAKAYRG